MAISYDLALFEKLTEKVITQKCLGLTASGRRSLFIEEVDDCNKCQILMHFSKRGSHLVSIISKPLRVSSFLSADPVPSQLYRCHCVLS
jgi:hypothetical protein